MRLGRAEIRRQIEEGARAIERATGERPVGFRAPGYTITDEVFDVLAELGVAYDSSVFPCPAYWAAKAAAIALIAAPRAHEPIDRRHAGGPRGADAPVPRRAAVLAARQRARSSSRCR